MKKLPPPVTPDGRYIVVRERLWRRANPNLSEEERAAFVFHLMKARRAVRTALASDDRDELAEARADVNAAKISLGERGPPWWNDDVDLNRHMVSKTIYAGWYGALESPT
jgi:hypothetical protein